MAPYWRDGCEIEIDDSLGQIGDDAYVPSLNSHEATYMDESSFYIESDPEVIFCFCLSCGVHLADDAVEENRGTCAACEEDYAVFDEDDIPW